MNDPRNEQELGGKRAAGEERLQVRFLKSAPDLRQCPPANAPEVAFAGRSNAGKSSVLNRLTGSRSTAKVSRTPGRTQLLNFFEVAGGGRLVDLPGYGYAKAARQAQRQWQRSVNEYLSHRQCLVGVVLVTDIRHPGQDFDTELLEWAVASELPLLMLLNKADKLKRNAQLQALRALQAATAATPSVTVQLFSASSGQGAEEAVCWVRERLQALPAHSGE